MPEMSNVLVITDKLVLHVKLPSRSMETVPLAVNSASVKRYLSPIPDNLVSNVCVSQRLDATATCNAAVDKQQRK